MDRVVRTLLTTTSVLDRWNLGRVTSTVVEAWRTSGVCVLMYRRGKQSRWARSVGVGDLAFVHARSGAPNVSCAAHGLCDSSRVHTGDCCDAVSSVRRDYCSS